MFKARHSQLRDLVIAPLGRRSVLARRMLDVLVPRPEDTRPGTWPPKALYSDAVVDDLRPVAESLAGYEGMQAMVGYHIVAFFSHHVPAELHDVGVRTPVPLETHMHHHRARLKALVVNGNPRSFVRQLQKIVLHVRKTGTYIADIGV